LAAALLACGHACPRLQWFLTCYGIINGACAFLAYEKSPNFRPTFRFYDWRLSLVGAIQCFGMMVFCAPTWYYAVLACSVAGGIYFYVGRQVGLQASGRSQPGCVASVFCSKRGEATDSDDEEGGGMEGGEDESGRTDWRSGRRFLAARESLLHLKPGDMEFKYWRPFILFLARTSQEDGKYVPQDGMIHLAHQLMKRGKGLSIFAGVVEGAFEEKHAFAETALKELTLAMKERQIEGFPEMICAPTRYEGYKTLVAAKGLGSLRPNTVMLGWPADASSMSSEEEESYCELLSYVALAKKTLLICRSKSGFPASKPGMVGSGPNSGVDEIVAGTIDVWWIFDLFPSKGLMLLLPYLLQQHRVWRACKTRLFVVASPDTDLTALKKLLVSMVNAGGMTVEVEILCVDPEAAPRFAASTSLTALDDKFGLKGAGGIAPSEGAKAESGDMVSILQRYSGDSPLVVLTLPKMQQGQQAGDWIRAAEKLVASLKRVIFVQESGHERIEFVRE